MPDNTDPRWFEGLFSRNGPGGIFDGINGYMQPTEGSQGVDAETLGQSRSTLLGHLGALLYASSMPGLQQGDRARLIGQMPQAFSASAGVMDQAGTRAYRQSMMQRNTAEIAKLRAETDNLTAPPPAGLMGGTSTLPPALSAPIANPDTAPAAAPAAATPGPRAGLPVPSAEVVAAAREESQRTGVPAQIILANLSQESGFNQAAVSPTGARGMGQLLASTARDPGMGVRPASPDALEGNWRENVRFSAEYLAGLQRDRGYTNPRDTLAAYNAGAGGQAQGKGYQHADAVLARVPYYEQLLNQGAAPAPARNPQLASGGPVMSDASPNLLPSGDAPVQVAQAAPSAAPSAAPAARPAPAPTLGDVSSLRVQAPPPTDQERAQFETLWRTNRAGAMQFLERREAKFNELQYYDRADGSRWARNPYSAAAPVMVGPADPARQADIERAGRRVVARADGSQIVVPADAPAPADPAYAATIARAADKESGERANSLSSRYLAEKDVQAFRSVQEGAQAIRQIIRDEPGAAADPAIISTFQRLLQPGLNVTDSEARALQRSAGLSDQLWADAMKAVNGTSALNPQTRAALVRMSEAIYDRALSTHDRIRETYTDLGRQQQIGDRYNVAPDQADREMRREAEGNRAIRAHEARTRAEQTRAAEVARAAQEEQAIKDRAKAEEARTAAANADRARTDEVRAVTPDRMRSSSVGDLAALAADHGRMEPAQQQAFRAAVASRVNTTSIPGMALGDLTSVAPLIEHAPATARRAFSARVGEVISPDAIGKMDEGGLANLAPLQPHLTGSLDRAVRSRVADLHPVDRIEGYGVADIERAAKIAPMLTRVQKSELARRGRILAGTATEDDR